MNAQGFAKTPSAQKYFQLIARKAFPSALKNYEKKRSIVIIDDDKTTKNLYRILLEKKGYQVSTSEGGQIGLSFLKNMSPPADLIFVDGSMPEMDGETFLLKLKEECPQIFLSSKIVGFTSYDSQSSTFQRIKKIAFDCREKPFGIEEFLKIVSSYIEKTSTQIYTMPLYEGAHS